MTENSPRDGVDRRMGIQVGHLLVFNFDMHIPFRFDPEKNEWKFAPEHVLKRGTRAEVCSFDDQQLTVQWHEGGELYRVSLPWIS